MAANIEDNPGLGQGATTSCLVAMAKIKGKVKFLLDIDQVWTSQELRALETVLS